MSAAADTFAGGPWRRHWRAEIASSAASGPGVGLRLAREPKSVSRSTEMDAHAGCLARRRSTCWQLAAAGISRIRGSTKSERIRTRRDWLRLDARPRGKGQLANDDEKRAWAHARSSGSWLGLGGEARLVSAPDRHWTQSRRMAPGESRAVTRTGRIYAGGPVDVALAGRGVGLWRDGRGAVTSLYWVGSSGSLAEGPSSSRVRRPQLCDGGAKGGSAPQRGEAAPGLVGGEARPRRGAVWPEPSDQSSQTRTGGRGAASSHVRAACAPNGCRRATDGGGGRRERVRLRGHKVRQGRGPRVGPGKGKGRQAEAACTDRRFERACRSLRRNSACAAPAERPLLRLSIP